MTSILERREYAHPRELVWRALTDSELLARWLMPNDFEARVGHEFTFRTEPGPGFDGIVRCRVRELDEPARMVWSWAGGPIDTVVTFTLEEVGPRRTRLTMEQAGFKGAKAWLVSRILKAGSRTIYGKRLPGVLDELAGGEGDDRRPDGACMTRSQGLIKRVLAMLPGGSK
jgi:uncharacterized protein YndB with AHSA1/START domain